VQAEVTVQAEMGREAEVEVEVASRETA